MVVLVRPSFSTTSQRDGDKAIFEQDERRRIFNQASNPSIIAVARSTDDDDDSIPSDDTTNTDRIDRMGDTSSSSSSITVSCPGKVLLLGGYLVLSTAHQGYVLSTPSRFYTTVEAVVVPDSDGDGDGKDKDGFTVQVRSPQFEDGKWDYWASFTRGSAEDREEERWTVKSTGQGSNPFVQIALNATLLLAAALAPERRNQGQSRNLRITVLASNDFYSQPNNTGSVAEAIVPFAPLGCTIRDVHKTGLGSSAAMVSSLCGALLSFLLLSSSSPLLPSTDLPLLASPRGGRTLSLAPDDDEEEPRQQLDKETLELVHNLAQYAHSLAQGKVGSGFDVSAAVWGSQVYRRFEPVCLDGLLKLDLNQMSSSTLHKALSPLLSSPFSSSSLKSLVSPFSLPPHLTLFLADVDAGSHTPSMVGKVLAWRSAKPEEAGRVWRDLGNANQAVAEALAGLGRRARTEKEEYREEVEKLASRKGEEWEKGEWRKLKEGLLNARRLMKEMGTLSSVPIEPDEQTALLDGCGELEGVVGGGVPGAGGYDALYILALSPSSSPSVVLDRITNFFKTFTPPEGQQKLSVRPLSGEAHIEGGKEGVEKGLRVENVRKIKGLREAIARGA